jgi:pimeloyl-ACP methyl ester carboxylesterase
MTRRTPKSVYWSQAVQTAVQDRYRNMLDAWSTEHAEHRLPTTQGETFVITAGRPGMPAVVLLPGSMATSAMWLRTIAALAGRFHVVAIDIIGDAGFSAASRPPMKSEAHARWLDDVLDAVGIKAAAFVGASFGGWPSLDYAIRRRSRVNGLALLAPAGIGRIRPAFMLKTAPLLFLGPWGHRRALRLDMGFSERGPSPDEREFLDLFDTVRSGFVARMQPIPVVPDRNLRQLDIPVLAVLGGRDAIFDSLETQKRIESNIIKSEVLMLPDAGHGLVNTTTIIRDFLLRSGLPKDASHAA